MTSLSEQVARVKELQANCYPDGVKDAQALGYAIFMFKQEADNMAAIIAQLWEEREQQHTVMEQARAILAATTLSPKGDEELVEALEKICGCTDEGVKNPISSHVMRDIARDALSRHQARLNGEG